MATQNWFDQKREELAQDSAYIERQRKIDAIVVTPELEAKYPQFDSWEEELRHRRIREVAYMEIEERERNAKRRAETLARRRSELVKAMGPLAEALVDALGEPKTEEEREEKFEKVLEALYPLHDRIERLGPHIIG